MFVGNEKKMWSPISTFASLVEFKLEVYTKKLAKVATFFMWVYFSVCMIVINPVLSHICDSWSFHNLYTKFYVNIFFLNWLNMFQ